MKVILLIFTAILGACTPKNDVPLESPTLRPPASATPLQKLELRRDPELEKLFAEIAKDANGKVGVAAVVLETGDAALLNADERYPMQSVYKLPIAMAVMDQVTLGKLDLDAKVTVTTEDMVRRGQASPLRDKNPNGGEFTIRELIRLALVESDGTASDVLMRVVGGPNAVQLYLKQIGIEDIKIVNTEKEFGTDWQIQFQNWATPSASIEMLRWLYTSFETEKRGSEGMPIDPTNTTGSTLIVANMFETVTGPRRLRGLMAKGGGNVAHKTGTSGTRNGVTAATNDIGLITLDNGRHVAIAVYVADSPADEKTREAVIARISRAAFDRWQK